jgi:hypothetical protein
VRSFHLADAEIGIGFEIRQASPKKIIEFSPFDRDRGSLVRAAEADLVGGYDGMIRAWNLNLFRSIGPDDLARVTHHPERGDESVDRMIRMLAGHDLNHLVQLEAIASQSG